jgi:hypothetical protein
MPKKSKLTLSIASDLSQRLDFQAARDGKGHDRSSILEDLIKDHVPLPDDLAAFLVGARQAGPTDDKASRRQSPRPVARGKTTFYLSVEFARRLSLHAVLTGEDRSSIVEGLIRDNFTPWNIYDPRESHLSTRRKSRQSDSAEINSPVADAA